VELTIDLDLQMAVEDALAATITRMNQEDPDETRGGAAVVEQVGTGEILAIASYPTYDLSTWRQSSVYAQLSADKANPFWNRATSTPYAPGSTLKPLTAVAALESGATTLPEKVRDTGRWYYPGDSNSYANCWKAGGHGLLNITGAITNS
jgi:penicillin-binding protein 2